MTYYCQIVLDSGPSGSHSVSFPDIRGIYSMGDGKEHALAMAKEALNGHLCVRLEGNYDIPYSVDRSDEGLFPIEVDKEIAQRMIKSRITLLKQEHKNRLEDLEKELEILENSIQKPHAMANF